MKSTTSSLGLSFSNLNTFKLNSQTGVIVCMIWLGLRTNFILRESVGNILVVEKVGTTKAKKEQFSLTGNTV